MNWKSYLRVFLAIYFLVTLMASIYSPDFISLTIITVGFFSMHDPLYITRRIFRLLLVLTLVSFLSTVTWLVYFHSEEADNA